jgi:hypothetical protein
MHKTSLLLVLLVALVLALGASIKAKAADKPTEPWLVLRSLVADQPQILSVRPSLPSRKVRSQFPVQATVRWDYVANETGMPVEEAELKAFYAFEEALRASDPDEQVFLQAIRSTGSGVRIWTFFVRSEAAFRPLLGQDAPVAVEFREDPSWSPLATILARTRR